MVSANSEEVGVRCMQYIARNVDIEIKVSIVSTMSKCNKHLLRHVCPYIGNLRGPVAFCQCTSTVNLLTSMQSATQPRLWNSVLNQPRYRVCHIAVSGIYWKKLKNSLYNTSTLSKFWLCRQFNNDSNGIALLLKSKPLQLQYTTFLGSRQGSNTNQYQIQ